ncbi:hypothetical protein HJC23_011446 [Cyclotella cryptica]|uniref:RING-type domain-containing protein n=1 Tax=Cyclotella cryptica TaxID=29204 RepID=A0ABD3NW89_9STRA|eukprot:CCRYP_019527-RA/>CCRYP_019527-RA protein AED:0.34 eAED:0.34 QI:0/-1/0/1/-1/1/1/0/791
MGIEANSQNRWRTARERARLKARYEIHSRIASHVVAACPAVTNNDSDKDDKDDDISTLHRLNTALRYLQAVIKNDLSAFSVAALARDGCFLNGALPLVACRDSSRDFDLSHGVPKRGVSSIEAAEFALCLFLSTACPWDEPDSTKPPSLAPHLQHQPATLAASKFGREFVATRLAPYMEHLAARGQQLTLIEYASLLGRHGIVALLLLGGVDPTRCAGESSRKVLALMHSLSCHAQAENDASPTTIPLSLWSYIVRALVEMRMNGVLDENTSRDTHSNDCCQLCHQRCTSSNPLLSFGPPCRHTYCEPCLWNHLVRHVPNCTSLTQNIVTCPKCHVDFEGFRQCCEQHRDFANLQSSPLLEVSHESKDDHQSSLQREQRRLDSFAKYMSLANTSAELKTVTKKEGKQDCQKKSSTHKMKQGRKKIRDPIHSTWGEALRPIISGHLSKDVRSDRFFKAVVSSPQMVIGYLEAGIDVNLQNVYGQTPLYIACWKGPGVIVESLLEYGADATIPANGGSTCWSVANELKRIDVLTILKKYGVNSGNVTECSMNEYLLHDDEREGADPQVTILIDPRRDHPGAGACIVDNALPEAHLQKLEILWRKLPVTSCGESHDSTTTTNLSNHNTSNEKSTYRPTRSYYCDAEQAIQSILLKCIDAARNALNSPLTNEGDESHSQQSPTTSGTRLPPKSVFHHLRFLRYEQKGGLLPPHVDLCRVDDSSGCRSTHTFILYLTDCHRGGGTALLQHLNDPKVLAVAQPKRGRALIFPHLCPHCGLEVDCVPKVLLRGEVFMQ